MKFESYNISSDIKRNLAKLGFVKPTDIQYKAIPSILRGEDVLAIAHTGTGKTAAFAIPIIDKIHSYKTSSRSSGIKCIVLEPTRELAQQVGEVFKTLARHTKVKAFSLFGGVEQDRQVAALQDGIDVLIATPGRMFDLIHQGFIRLEGVSTLVLDEADRMLDMGFIDDVKFIKRMLTSKHQTLFFSATINPEIKKLAFSQVKSSAIRIQISPDDPISKNISHFVMYVEADDKRFFLERFITENPNSKMIVFVRTRVRADRVAQAMMRVHIPALVIHGEKEQHDRSQVMESFRAGKCQILIATDVNARGIDIPDVDIVINYDLPEKAENYVHRIGRTGRGMNKGSAISFCSSEEKGRLEEIQKFIAKEISVLRISKSEYSFTVKNRKGPTTAQDLVLEHLEWLEDQKRKKKSRSSNKKRSFSTGKKK